jgi:hypothetical protein
LRWDVQEDAIERLGIPSKMTTAKTLPELPPCHQLTQKNGGDKEGPKGQQIDASAPETAVGSIILLVWGGQGGQSADGGCGEAGLAREGKKGKNQKKQRLRESRGTTRGREGHRKSVVMAIWCQVQ